METMNLIQGSDAWLAHRAKHFNASDAPAMMGISPYKTRTQLLHELHTGCAPDVDAATQRRFDDGHRYEALARPLAEEIIGQALYPVTGSEGELSASFDGLTMGEDIGFEHKSLNDELRTIMDEHCTGADLPAMYQVQMEQQCMVSGAESILFMASKWNGENLIEERHCCYTPNPELRKAIIRGWAQFATDLATYSPKVITEAPKADAIERLPALAVLIKGEVISSNLPAFREAATQFIANIKTDLVTDQDFSDADANVKFCEKAEKDLEQAKAAAISQTASIDELMRTVDFIKDQLRTKRLALEKLVVKRKTEIKDEVLRKALFTYLGHVQSLESEMKPLKLTTASPDFAGAAKNKRTLASLHDAVDGELARAKINADAIAKDMRNKLAWCNVNAEHFGFLLSDMQQIIQKPMDDFQLVVKTRIDAHKVSESAKEERIKADAIAAANVVIETAKAITPTVATITPIQVTAHQIIGTTSKSALNAVRVELNGLLDRLNDDQLQRIINFVKSRYPAQAAA